MPENPDPYLYPGTNVLRNIPNLRDSHLLATFEANATAARLIELEEHPLSGQFDLPHIKAIHWFIFQDVFAWAGEFRTVNISKGGQLFGLAQFIEPAMIRVLGNLAVENYLAGLDRERFAGRAGYYLGEINAIHAFREGNGRTQREFIRELALRSGYRVIWTRITAWQMVDASVQSFKHGDHTGLAALILNCLKV